MKKVLARCIPGLFFSPKMSPKIIWKAVRDGLTETVVK